MWEQFKEIRYLMLIVFHYRLPFAERSTSPIHLSAVMCNGTELRITDCPHSNSTQNLNHGYDVYIVCRPDNARYSSKDIIII